MTNKNLQNEIQEVKELIPLLKEEIENVKRFSPYMANNMLNLGIRHNDSKLTEFLQWRESLQDKESQLYHLINEAAHLYRDTRVVLEKELEKRTS